MLTFILYQEFNEILTDKILINLHFCNVGFFNYSCNPKLIFFNSDLDKNLFYSIISHPLVHWKIEFICKHATFTVDLINNLTTHAKYPLCYTYNNKGVCLVHNPCIFFGNNSFNESFIYGNRQPDFSKFNPDDFRITILKFLKDENSVDQLYHRKYLLGKLFINKVSKLHLH